MINSVTVTNYLGNSITLTLSSPEESGLIVKEITGLGPSDANINTTEVATQDGSIYNSARLNERNIVFDLQFLHKPDIESTRHLTYKYFPIKKRVKLTFNTDYRDTYIYGYVEKNEPDIFSKDEGCQISIICPDPYFYSSELITKVFSGIEPLFEFPFENDAKNSELGGLLSIGRHLPFPRLGCEPFGSRVDINTPVIEMSKLNVDSYANIVYDGDAETGVTMNIHALGPVKNLRIASLRTNGLITIDDEKLEAITGKGIVANDDIIITSQPGNKTVTLLRNGERTNILNCLDKHTEWFTLTKGDNEFMFVADEGMLNVQFSMSYNLLYEGV